MSICLHSTMTMKQSISAIVLASGQGSRFKGIKQLADINGAPMIRMVIDTLSSVVEDVVVVLGAHIDEIRPKIEHMDVSLVENRDWQSGMSSSIRTGLEHMKKQSSMSTHVMIALADQPFITADQLVSLVHASKAHPDRCVASKYPDAIGVPAIFPKAYWDVLMKIEGDKGARRVLRDDPTVIGVEIPTALRDIDTLNDLV